ncbi:fluoride efflux transporter CrcB [Salinispora arenicola]|uniref:Fluoride-specific ion channel FluC n=2 Tax=Salinispora arenicola TaxID=168697 RepID=A0A542XRJ3_SALAC|nr:fluoride efflux transporter CrcB [Salinispora arenicola]MCN0151007.1 fluoride efflux transporter CrcB [Salinispora arenicola]NIL42265.1 fluoride efflux transporter CrcB [Salinispora arenicola]NIL58577.1 fluoride efflux transporter CrcB [Salinispora arenicola]NIL60966.1 fluoride efflux transporter CrcB [Salinispora arenicola]TQL38467.1 camphor resistance protein CrcB [Salinispora arenicola]
MTALLVALGAAVGAPLRYLADRAVQARFGAEFPWGTLTVNVAGSLLLGFLLGLPVPPAASALLGTGLCGALTTYSTASYETLRLATTGRLRSALVNALVGVAAAVVAATLGHLAATALP